MSEIIIIVAVADNNVIGKGGKIPWYIKEDFQHFKDLTIGNVCLMGDRTYDSLPIRPLPGRENVIITFNKEYEAPGAKIFYSFEDALSAYKNKKIYICGGATVYRIALPIATRLELTRVHKKYEGDTFFPEIDFSKWKLTKEEKHEGFTFQTFIRN
jgi:dihydrofolate reductase